MQLIIDFIRPLRVIGVAIGLVGPVVASADVPTTPGREPNGYTWGELALLPEYCRDVMGVFYGDSNNPSPRAAHWIELMGNDFWHMHHYCRALREKLKGDLAILGSSYMNARYAGAQGDFEYMLRNASPQMPLMPEILVQYGQMKHRMQEFQAALDLFERARTLKADYWPAYTRALDLLIETKAYEQAQALADEGLRVIPGNEEILRRVTLLENARKQRPRAVAPAPARKASAATHTATSVPASS